jgi:histidinol-phosphate aminotransferase
MKNLAKKHLAKIKTYRPGKPMEEVKRELGLRDVIKLASNESAFPPSTGALAGIIGAARDLNRYPDGGCFYLKRDLAKNFRLKPENFIIGNGSDEIITFAVRTFLKKGEEVIISEPTFLIYDIVSRVENVRIRHVPLTDYRYNLNAMKKAVTKKTKMVFIANPDNPTGTYVTKKEVEKFMAGLRKDIIVFFDEAYYEFAIDLKDYPDTLKFLKKKRNIIITRSFSKAYSLAGLRIGYGVAGEYIIDAMSKVREPFNVNSLAQVAARAALRDTGYVRRTKDFVRNGKEFLYGQLDSMGIGYIPSATNFILVKIGKDAAKIYDGLLKRGVIVRNMAAWGLDDCLRVTIGTTKENLRFINTLKSIYGLRRKV